MFSIRHSSPQAVPSVFREEAPGARRRVFLHLLDKCNGIEDAPTLSVARSRIADILRRVDGERPPCRSEEWTGAVPKLSYLSASADHIPLRIRRRAIPAKNRTANPERRATVAGSGISPPRGTRTSVTYSTRTSVTLKWHDAMERNRCNDRERTICRIGPDGTIHAIRAALRFVALQGSGLRRC